MASTESTGKKWVKKALTKAATLIVLGILCAWFYEFGSTRFYREGETAGFKLGMLHGALMPMALPGLLMGKDPSIYADKNTGRTYKLGYIAGINLCGLIVFGAAFWSPKDKSRKA